MNRKLLTGMAFALVASVAQAGVVIEMEVKDPGSKSSATDTIYAEGKMLRMDPHGSQRGDRSSILFRDETMWLIDHDKKRCQTIDKQGMEQMSAQLGGAMKQLEAQMAQIPPEQRAMMEKMMKGKMPGGMGADARPRRVVAGGAETVGAYSCNVHTLYSGDEKVWEVCAAKESAVAEFAEAMGAFRALSDFTEDLRESLTQGPLASMIQTPFSEMKQIDGLPVRVRNFAGGKLQSESTLKTVARRDIEKTLFAAPESYKCTRLADEMKQGR